MLLLPLEHHLTPALSSHQCFLDRMNWFALFEAHLTNALIRSPTFNHVVRQMHRKVEGVKKGQWTLPEERTGMELDQDPKTSQSQLGIFFRHLRDELRNQMKETKGGNR